MVSTRGDQQLCCPRCTNALAPATVAAPHFEPDWAAEMWELEEDLHELDRLAGRLAPQTDSRTAPFAVTRTDARHAHDAADRDAPSTAPVDVHPDSANWRLTVGWLLILPGTTSLAAGGALIGWAVWSGIDAYWRSGAPLLIAGQVMVMAGVMLCLDAAAKSRLMQCQALEALSRQLEQRSRAATVPPPHKLLADIKAHLDRLPLE